MILLNDQDDLREEVTLLALAAVKGGKMDYTAAAYTLASACAILIALVPDSEHRDILDELRRQMPEAVELHAARLLEAGIAQAQAMRQ